MIGKTDSYMKHWGNTDWDGSRIPKVAFQYNPRDGKMGDFQDRDRHWEVETGQRPNPLKQDNDDDDFTKRDDITDV